MSSSVEHASAPLSLAVLISGRGSNLQAIIEAIDRGEIPARIRVVFSNRPRAGGLALAQQAGIPVEVIDREAFTGRDDFDRALLDRVSAHAPDLVVLAGFMHILSPAFVRAFDDRLMNIHPSLLPAFPGLHTHQRALAEGVAEHGASVHFVTEELDGGPVIIRGRLPVTADDDPGTLARRVLAIEHRIYPLAVRLFAEGRLRKTGPQILLDGRPLTAPLDLADVDGR